VNVTVRGEEDETTIALRSAQEFFNRFFSATAKQQSRLVRRAPLADLQTAALLHPDPRIRRDHLFFLDHYANDVSTTTFAEALRDPVDFVRNAALHSIACEGCRTTQLCTRDVVACIVRIVEDDPSPDLRTKAISVLLRLGDRDRRAWEAIVWASEHDPDRIVRCAAAGALGGQFVAPRKRYERARRRHDRQAVQQTV
jgi:HEAT repeat protein